MTCCGRTDGPFRHVKRAGSAPAPLDRFRKFLLLERLASLPRGLRQAPS